MTWNITSGLIAVISVMATFGALFFGDYGREVVLLSAGLAVVAAISVLWGLVVTTRASWLGASRARQFQWGKVMPTIAQAVAAIGHIGSPPVPQSRETHLADAISHLGTAFTAVTGEPCQVTIKQVYARDDGALMLRNVAAHRRAHPSTSTEEDYVDANTDFADIMGGADHFFSNDLVADLAHGYQNSHWPPEKLDEWARTGSYPYRAAIVTPVRVDLPASHNSRERQSIVGFVCVDTGEAGSFNEAYDVEPCELFAAALQAVWYELTQNEPRGEAGD